GGQRTQPQTQLRVHAGFGLRKDSRCLAPVETVGIRPDIIDQLIHEAGGTANDRLSLDLGHGTTRLWRTREPERDRRQSPAARESKQWPRKARRTRIADRPSRSTSARGTN